MARLILEFGGAALDELIIEWLKRVEMIGELADEERVECILRLRLTGWVLAVYRQYSRADIEAIKCALTTAFIIDVFVAFEQLAMRQFCDELLAALERLAH